MASQRPLGDRFVSEEIDFRSHFSSPIKDCCSSYDYVRDYQKYRRVLSSELKMDSTFEMAWENAKASDKYNGILEEEEERAIKAYTTNNPPFYRDFNHGIRNHGAQNKAFEYNAMYFFLHHAVDKISRTHGSFHVYRGVLVDYQPTTGENFQFTSFASCSKRRDVALGFGTRPGRMGQHIILFDIQSTNKGADISKYSYYSLEEEVLIPPCELFQVSAVRSQSMQCSINGIKTFDTSKVVTLVPKS